MNKSILAVAVLMSSVAANATSSNNVQKQIDDLKAGLHDVHMNTLQKYSESWGLEDRANIAKLQQSKVDKTVFAADQARQDKALSDAMTTQGATDAGQDQRISSVQSAAQTANDRATALEGRADTAENGIRDVQGAVQTANDRATALEGRADGTEAAIRETNAQLQVTDERSQNNATRLDGVEQTNARHDEKLTDHETRITGTEKTAKAQGDTLTNHEARITGTETTVTRQGQQLENHEGRITSNTQNISTLNNSLNEYQATSSAAITSGDARTLQSANSYTNSKFGELKSQVDGNSRQIEENRNEARAGIAGAMAMSQIPQVSNYGDFSVGAGVGQYVNQQAVAVGFSARLSQGVITKGAVSADSGSNFGAGLGIGVEW